MRSGKKGERGGLGKKSCAIFIGKGNREKRKVDHSQEESTKEMVREGAFSTLGWRWGAAAKKKRSGKNSGAAKKGDALPSHSRGIRERGKKMKICYQRVS